MNYPKILNDSQILHAGNADPGRIRKSRPSARPEKYSQISLRAVRRVRKLRAGIDDDFSQSVPVGREATEGRAGTISATLKQEIPSREGDSLHINS